MQLKVFTRVSLRIGLLVLAALCAAPSAWAQEKVSLRLNWLYYGFHSFFVLGVEKGFYKAEGIDLTIGEGKGSGRTVQAVADRADTFGLSDGGSVVAGVAKGAPIVAVMGIMNKSPFAVIARADSGIWSAKDLEGKTIAVTTGEAGLAIFSAIVHANKLDADKIKLLRTDGPGKMDAVLNRRADAMIGGMENQALILLRRSVAVVSMPYSLVGANTLGLVIHVHKDTAAKKPELIHGFIRATQRAIAEAEKNPMQAIEALARVKPDIDKDLAFKQLNAGLLLVRAVGASGQPIGTMLPRDWDKTLHIAQDYQDVRTSLKATDFYTNDLIPGPSP